MKPLASLLRELARAEVAEFAVVSDRLPCVKLGDVYEPVDDSTTSSDEILGFLSALGGARYVADLASRPAQWTTRVDDVGLVSVAATMRSGRVQARLARVRPPSRPPPRRSRPPGRPSTRPGAPPPPRGALQPSSSLADPEADSLLGPAVVTRKTVAPRSASARSLDDWLALARKSRASDLHVVAGRPVRMRVRGELVTEGDAIAEAAAAEMILPLLPPHARAAMDEHGSCDFALSRPGSGRFRANVSRQRTGLKACLRCIGDEVPTLASLGLPPEIARATQHHQGLVLVTGPTGHGKTSTLAALVDIINSETTHHVITVEDPVEYLHPRKRAMISQREVGAHTRSFQSALKASLREDPDVIVVGELRDTETVRMALAASETGHLVLGTMNTPSAAKTIDRTIDLFPPADQAQVRMALAGGLHLVVSQRLVPAADGSGRIAAVELLPGSLALWSLIRDGKTFQIPSLQQRGKALGIVRLDDSLAELVRSGRVSRADALAFAENPDDFDAALSPKQTTPAAPAAPTPPRADGGGLLGKAGQLFKANRGS